VIRVYIADALPQERLALRLVLIDLNMEIAGEADNWLTTLAEMPIRSIDMLVAGWELLSAGHSAALDELRRACPNALVIVLIGGLEVRRQAALSTGSDGFISKGELPERVVEHLRAAAAKIHT